LKFILRSSYGFVGFDIVAKRFKSAFLNISYGRSVGIGLPLKNFEGLKRYAKGPFSFPEKGASGGWAEPHHLAFTLA